ncbi:prostaglandin D2 receptor 2 isoform X1 [Alosa pseudoharengus]|uniref:prostaglandin D2 receptor 2 isoform X1 n=2 Tax=Alosa pseudoharengus TaxID=34774 RepID=UPI003F89E6C0
MRVTPPKTIEKIQCLLIKSAMDPSFSISNSSFPSLSSTELYCPLLQKMRLHSVNSTGDTTAVVCIHGLVSCLGIIENALVLWVLGVRLRRKTVAAVWMLNLALSDFLATLTLPLFTHYLHAGHSWELGAPLCSAQASVFFLNMYVSAYLLAAISLDRCLLVTRPVWSQNHRSVAAAWKVCAVGWLWAAVNAFPYFMFRSVTPHVDGRRLCYHNFALYSSKAALKQDCRVRQAATAVSKTLLAFVVPLVVIASSYMYFGLSLQARNRRRLRENSCMGLADSGGSAALVALKLGSGVAATSGRLSRGFTKMVASVIAAFILCWAPYHAFCLLEVAAQYEPDRFARLVERALPLATTCAFLNPVLNPILYAFSCPHFCTRIRQSLSALLEGLVEEGGGVSMAGGLVRRRTTKAGESSSGSPNSPTSPNTPGLSRHTLSPQNSVNGCIFKKCPTEDTCTDSLRKVPFQETADIIM